MIRSGHRTGWFVASVFGVGLVIWLIIPVLPKMKRRTLPDRARPELDTLTSRSIILVRGYVRGVDRRPKRAEVAVPYRRLAVIVNSAYPEFPGGHFFDHDLVLKICSAIAQGRRVQVTGVVSKQAITLDQLRVHWQAGWETDDYNDPGNNNLFDQLLVFENNVVVADVRGIPYHAFGGPSPYHDSYTLEVFVQERAVKDLSDAIQATASQAGAKVEFIEGVPEP